MRALSAVMFGTLLVCGAAGAAEQAASPPVGELAPVHINAMRDPEVRKYKAILAGLDAFDKHHRLAPAVDRLQFRAIARTRDDAPAPLGVRLAGDDGFSLPLAIDGAGRFSVPRSEAAEDAESELELNRKRLAYRVSPDIRTPGLPANQRRLGDLRLECKVTVAIAKEEIPFLIAMLVNGVLRTSDWCSFFDEKKNSRFGFRAESPISAALLREGERTLQLKADQASFEVPIGSQEWSDDAVIELTPAPAPAGTP